MTSTRLWHFLTPSPLCPPNIHCLSANLGYFLTPPSVRTSYMEAPIRLSRHWPGQHLHAVICWRETGSSFHIITGAPVWGLRLSQTILLVSLTKDHRNFSPPQVCARFNFETARLLQMLMHNRPLRWERPWLRLSAPHRSGANNNYLVKMLCHSWLTIFENNFVYPSHWITTDSPFEIFYINTVIKWNRS